jgi:hypothetical protein
MQRLISVIGRSRKNAVEQSSGGWGSATADRLSALQRTGSVEGTDGEDAAATSSYEV